MRIVLSVEREVFILPNGESFSVWDVRFGSWEQREETAPCTFEERDGSKRTGTIRFTVESADISFTTFAGSLKIGQEGQLSSVNDEFFEVKISLIEPMEGNVRVFGRASRKSSFRENP